MIRLRDSSWRRFGASLAGVALYLQLAFASWGVLALASTGGPSDAFGGHALCLAAQDGGTQQPTAPAGAPAAPLHDHGAFCCLWHPLPAIQALTAETTLPVAYAEITLGDFSSAWFIAGPRREPRNARAPPTLT